MDVMAYIGQEAGIGVRLRRAIASVLPGERLVLLRSLADMSACLSAPGRLPGIVVLLAADREELSRMGEMAPLLADLKLILILPDACQESYTMGCRLYPRFISDRSSDFSDVAAVLEKMCAVLETPHPQLRDLRQANG